MSDFEKNHPQGEERHSREQWFKVQGEAERDSDSEVSVRCFTLLIGIIISIAIAMSYHNFGVLILGLVVSLTISLNVFTLFNGFKQAVSLLGKDGS
jgi:hypothetical protein